ncbi:hypothetical protein HMPREF1504_1251 [Veillonella sp. ICM51a]|nr:hypothetical protein HMPREF1504_1251 [Veillonella sp. ICM51a]
MGSPPNYLRKALAKKSAALLIAHVSRWRRSLCSVLRLFFSSAFNSFNDTEAFSNELACSVITSEAFANSSPCFLLIFFKAIKSFSLSSLIIFNSCNSVACLTVKACASFNDKFEFLIEASASIKFVLSLFQSFKGTLIVSSCGEVAVDELACTNDEQQSTSKHNKPLNSNLRFNCIDVVRDFLIHI